MEILAFTTSDKNLNRFNLVVGSKGCYCVDLSDKTVRFSSKLESLESPMSIILSRKCDFVGDVEPLDSPYNPSGKAMHYEWGRVNVKGISFILDYLDTTKGKILRHPHVGKVVEVYMSAKAPFVGTICDIGEEHEPFADETIAVKLIYGDK